MKLETGYDHRRMSKLMDVFRSSFKELEQNTLRSGCRTPERTRMEAEIAKYDDGRADPGG